MKLASARIEFSDLEEGVICRILEPGGGLALRRIRECVLNHADENAAIFYNYG